MQFTVTPLLVPTCGGDLGFVQQSALDKVAAELRTMVMGLQAGQISRVIHTQAGAGLL